MAFYTTDEKTIADKERARHAKGRFILVVGIIMLTLFFGLLIALMTVSLSAA